MSKVLSEKSHIQLIGQCFKLHVSSSAIIIIYWPPLTGGDCQQEKHSLVTCGWRTAQLGGEIIK